MAFPLYTTHHLCPLDKCLFGPLKSKWNSVSFSHMRDATENTINKGPFCHLFNDAYSQPFTWANIVAGFEATGIVVWNPLALPVDAFAPSVPHNKIQEEAPEHFQPFQSDTHPICWVMRKVTQNVDGQDPMLPLHLNHNRKRSPRNQQISLVPQMLSIYARWIWL